MGEWPKLVKESQDLRTYSRDFERYKFSEHWRMCTALLVLVVVLVVVVVVVVVCCCWKLEHQVQSAGCQGYFHIQLDAWGQDWTTPKRPAKTETFMKEAFTWTAGCSGNSYSRALPPGCFFCLADMILADCVFSCSNRIASGVATCVVDESIGSWL